MRYIPKGICPSAINIETANGTISDVQFEGGCNGNLKAVSGLVKGMKIQDAIDKLKGIQCGSRASSCPDQLAKALESMSANS